ncbi:MAG: TonB-dependent receptor [Burkholderiales bacterium]|nr:TonB-dependent receptor [Burkholderiales bacterium]
MRAAFIEATVVMGTVWVIGSAPAQTSEVLKVPAVPVSAQAVRGSITVPSVAEAKARLDRTPGGTALVEPETYKEGRSATLTDALTLAPGVLAQSRFGSDEARLSIRGSGIQRTFHLRGIQLLQDGAPLNQADGSGDFQAVDPLAVQYIEVYRGANALQYGATTLGGAINFVSPTGYTAPRLTVRAEGGSYGYLRGQVALANVIDDTDYYVSFSATRQDGFRDWSDQSNQRLFANIGRRFGSDVETRFYFTVVDTDSKLPGNLFKRELENNPEAANPINVQGRYKRDFRLYRVANRTTVALGEGMRLEANVFYTWKDLYHPIFQVLDVTSRDYGADLRFSADGTLFGARNLLVAGVRPTRGTADDQRHANVNGQRGVLTGDSRQTSANFDVYVEDQLYVLPNVAAIAGAQWSRSTRRLRDNFLADGQDNGVDRTYNGFSPKLGARWEVTPLAQVFANVSRSFEPPSFGELAGGPTVTPVREQEATTWEVGTRGTLEALTWDAAYYRARVTDELLTLLSPTGIPLGTVNAARTRHQGVELAGSTLLARRWELRASYLWNDFRFDADPVFGNNRLPGLPEHLLNAQAMLRFGAGFYAGPTVQWSPQSYSVDMANTLRADGYALLGFRVGQRKDAGLSWFLEARNLTDERYAASTGVIATAGGLDSRQFLPGDGRSIYGGIEWKL